MADPCCQLVGNLDLGMGWCVTSINTSVDTEIVTACLEGPLAGPSTFKVSLTGYADTSIWVGCPAKAGVNLNYLTKYDCKEDKVHFIPNGKGQAYIAGEIPTVYLLSSLVKTTSLSASSASGPTGIYMYTDLFSGYGMVYTGDPIPFDTEALLEDTVGNYFTLGILGGNFLLESFSYDAQPGQFPTVSYTFKRQEEGVLL